MDGNLWAGTAVSGFKATMNAKTGKLAGRMKFFLQKRGGKGSPAAKTFKVAGVLIGDTVYCSALHGAYGSYPVKVSACDACED